MQRQVVRKGSSALTLYDQGQWSTCAFLAIIMIGTLWTCLHVTLPRFICLNITPHLCVWLLTTTFVVAEELWAKYKILIDHIKAVHDLVDLFDGAGGEFIEEVLKASLNLCRDVYTHSAIHTVSSYHWPSAVNATTEQGLYTHCNELSVL